MQDKISQFRMQQLRWFTTALTCCIGLALCSIGETNESWQPRHVKAVIELVPDGRGITVPVKIGGRSWEFLIDTGCTMSMVDNQLVSLLGEPAGLVQARSPDGRESHLPTYNASKMQCVGIPLDLPEGVACIDLEGFRKGGLAPIYGILGMDWLSRFPIHLDFDKNRLLIISHLDSDETPPGLSVDMIIGTDNIPKVRMKFSENVISDMSIDTGAIEYNYLSGRVCDQIRKLGAGDYCGVTARTRSAFGQESIADLFRCKSVPIGNSVDHDIVFMVGNGDDDSLLGIRFLKRFRVTMLCSKRRVYFDPGKEFGSHDHSDFDGMTIGQSANGQLVVANVSRDSLASKSGVLRGDIIKKIGAKRVRGYSTSDLLRLLTTERGPSLTVDIERQKKESQLNFRK